MAEGENNLEKLWYAYPDISVMRLRSGELFVSQQLDPEFFRSLKIHPLFTAEQNSIKGLEPYEVIEVRKLHNDFGKRKYGLPDAEIVLNPQGPNVSIVVQTNMQEYRDEQLINEILIKARQGLELLGSLHALPEDQRLRYASRVSDELRTGGIKMDIQQLEQQGIHIGLAEMLASEEVNLGFRREYHAAHAFQTLRKTPKGISFERWYIRGSSASARK